MKISRNISLHPPQRGEKESPRDLPLTARRFRNF